MARIALAAHDVIAEERSAGGTERPNRETESLELSLLLDGVYRLSGFDFREYAPAGIRRLVLERVRTEGLPAVSALLDRVIHDPAALERLLHHLTAQPSAPFRDPQFFASLAHHVFPRLRTYPSVRIWVAGSGSGGDLYSIAILLREAGLAHKMRIYATESTDRALDEARAGILPEARIAEVEERYRASGGTSRLGDYLETDGSTVRFNDELRKHVLFARHHLPSESSFNVFHAVVTRPPLRLFGRAVMYRVHRTLYESLERSGFLCLTSRETLDSSPHAGAYERLTTTESVFRRVR